MKKLIAGLILVGAAAIAYAGTFNLFQPATGILKGAATTYVTTAAANTDVIGLWSGTCNSSSFLRGDGACATPAGGASAANPTASVGLAAVNGVAATYLRSDGAPALSQAIVPTWTGLHTHAVASGDSLDLFPSGAIDPVLKFYRLASTVGLGVGRITADGQNASSTQVDYSLIQTEISANTAGSHQGRIIFQTAQAGTLTTALTIDGATLSAPAGGILPINRVVKGTTTSRNSNTTLTADPELVLTGLDSTKTYKIEFCLSFDDDTTGTQGFKFAFQNGTAVGTYFLNYNGAFWANSVTGAMTGVQTSVGSGIQAVNTFSTITVGVNGNSACATGTYRGGDTGLKIVWSQNSSSANNTNLRSGSWLAATLLN